MTAARSRPWRRTSSGAAGVGSTPASSASPPAAATPAAIADSSIAPDSRVSRMISTCGRSRLSAGDRRARQPERELGREECSRAAADTVRAESLARHRDSDRP